MLIARTGVTLVELLVTLAVAGIVLSLVGAVALREQRLLTDLGERRNMSERLTEAAGLLPIALRSAAPSDIREALDTALELRATIASAIVCDTAASTVVLMPAGVADAPYASIMAPLDVGDTLWSLAMSAASPAWIASRIETVNTVSGASCDRLAPALTGPSLAGPRIAIGLATVSPILPGTVVRVTRAMRLSLYQGTDGRWYLGEREWNDALGRFNTVQPMAGPYLSAAAGGAQFEYVNTTGDALHVPVANPMDIALVRIRLRAKGTGQVAASDSVLVAMALRNRM